MINLLLKKGYKIEINKYNWVLKKEKKFKEKLEQLLSNEFYKPLIDKEKKDKIEKYISKDWIYFKEKKYDEEAIAVLEESIYLYYSIFSKAPFTALKDLLDYQITLLDNK